MSKVKLLVLVAVIAGVALAGSPCAWISSKVNWVKAVMSQSTAAVAGAFGFRKLLEQEQITSALSSEIVDGRLEITSDDHLRYIRFVEGIKELKIELKDMETLPHLPSSLISLDLSNCPNLVNINSIKDVGSLQSLIVNGCQEFDSVAKLNNLTSLKSLQIGGVTLSVNNGQINIMSDDQLCCIGSLKGIKQMKIEVKDMETLPDLPSSLTHLDLCNCPNLVNIDSTKVAASLKTLILTGAAMETLPDLPSSLTYLYLSYCRNLVNIDSIKDVASLETLYLMEAAMETLPDLPSSLTYLHLSNCPNLVNIDSFDGAASLETLYLIEAAMETLPDLPSSLIYLDLSNCRNLVNIDSIKNVASLKNLVLKELPMIASVPPLPSSLIYLRVICCPKLTNVDSIESATKLAFVLAGTQEECVPLANSLVAAGRHEGTPYKSSYPFCQLFRKK